MRPVKSETLPLPRGDSYTSRWTLRLLVEGRDETPRGLAAADIALLRGEGGEVSARPGEVVVAEGTPGDGFFVVLEGEATVVRLADGASSLPLARLGPGATFGEMALLGGGPVSASVVAATPLRLFRIPKERFPAALEACEPLRLHLLSRLARDLRRTSDGAVGLHRKAEVLRALLTRGGEREPVVAESAAMKRLVQEVGRLASSSGPVLVTGPPGAGRSFAARLLHERTSPGAPFFVVSARRLAPGDLERLFAGPAPVAESGTVVLRHVDALPDEGQRSLAGILAAQEGAGILLRFVATAGVGAGVGAGTGAGEPGGASRLLPLLAERFGERRLRVPGLAERKLDVVPLARLFLERAKGEGRGRILSPGAERKIAARSFPRRQVGELRETMELASLLAQGEEVRAEELFTGPREDLLPFLVDLTDFPGLRGAVTGRALEAVRWGTVALFGLLTVLLVLAPGWPASRALNAVSWGLWEPLLIASFLLAGRLWCTICPFSKLSRMAQRLAGRGLRPPEWLVRHGVELSAAGFAAIVWAEREYRMPDQPLAAGLFFALLALLAAVTALLFEREVFCRRLCPLGTLGAACSLAAPFQLRSTPGVCGSLCRTHDCFRGNAAEPGCPAFHHPLYLEEGHACKACFQCLRSCPHTSVRFGFRWPLQGVWRLGGASGELAPFVTTVFAVSVALFVAHLLRIEGGAPWASLSLGALAIGLWAGRFLGRLVREGEGGARLGRLVFSFLVLGWALMLSCEVGNWSGAAALRIEPVGIPLLALARGAIVVFGLLLTAICLFNLNPRPAER